MLKTVLVLVLSFLTGFSLRSQGAVQDSIYFMNGLVVGEKIIDTTLGAITIKNPKKPQKNIHFEVDQLYMVRYANGNKRYYYVQDSAINNIFTRDEMWYFTKGENDARRGFKAKGALIGGCVAGVIGGMTGTIWGPIAPFGFMALTGITKVKIKHETISDPKFIDQDAYILGYERVARQKRKTKSLLGGAIGIVVGFGLYLALNQYYPTTINVGFNR